MTWRCSQTARQRGGIRSGPETPRAEEPRGSPGPGDTRVPSGPPQSPRGEKMEQGSDDGGRPSGCPPSVPDTGQHSPGVAAVGGRWCQPGKAEAGLDRKVTVLSRDSPALSSPSWVLRTDSPRACPHSSQVPAPSTGGHRGSWRPPGLPARPADFSLPVCLFSSEPVHQLVHSH